MLVLEVPKAIVVAVVALGAGEGVDRANSDGEEEDGDDCGSFPPAWTTTAASSMTLRGDTGDVVFLVLALSLAVALAEGDGDELDPNPIPLSLFSSLLLDFIISSSWIGLDWIGLEVLVNPMCTVNCTYSRVESRRQAKLLVVSTVGQMDRMRLVCRERSRLNDTSRG